MSASLDLPGNALVAMTRDSLLALRAALFRDVGPNAAAMLQALGIPPWERRQLPLLWRGDMLWAAGDLVLSAAADTWLRRHGARLVWQRG